MYAPPSFSSPLLRGGWRDPSSSPAHPKGEGEGAPSLQRLVTQGSGTVVLTVEEDGRSTRGTATGHSRQSRPHPGRPKRMIVCER